MPLEPISSWLQLLFRNINYDPIDQTMVSILIGIILGPFEWGIFFLIVFILWYETFFYIFSRGEVPYYDLFTRLAVNCGYLFGYILSRTVFCDQVLDHNVPFQE